MGGANSRLPVKENHTDTTTISMSEVNIITRDIFRLPLAFSCLSYFTVATVAKC